MLYLEKDSSSIAKVYCQWSQVLWGHPNEFILQQKSLVRRVHTIPLKERELRDRERAERE